MELNFNQEGNVRKAYHLVLVHQPVYAQENGAEINKL
jgi:hypothetical protein